MDLSTCNLVGLRYCIFSTLPLYSYKLFPWARHWPAGTHLEQLLPCAFQEVPDGLLGNALLKVGIDPTEGELLPCVLARLLEGVGMEASIVAVIMKDLDSMFYSLLFKCELGSKCFVGLVIKLEVDKVEVAAVVDEDGGALIALLGKFAFELCIKTYFRWRHLIYCDALSRFGCHKDLVVGLGFLASPWKLGHRAKKAASTLGRQHCHRQAARHTMCKERRRRNKCSAVCSLQVN